MTKNKRFILTEQFNGLQGVTFVKDDCADVDTYYTVDGTVDLLNELNEENKTLKHKLQQQEMEYATTSHRLAEENQHIKDTIKQAYNNERTQLGRNVLKQLMEAIQ